MDGHLYEADENKEILIPFSSSSGFTQIIVIKVV